MPDRYPPVSARLPRVPGRACLRRVRRPTRSRLSAEPFETRRSPLRTPHPPRTAPSLAPSTPSAMPSSPRARARSPVRKRPSPAPPVARAPCPGVAASPLRAASFELVTDPFARALDLRAVHFSCRIHSMVGMQESRLALARIPPFPLSFLLLEQYQNPKAVQPCRNPS